MNFKVLPYELQGVENGETGIVDRIVKIDLNRATTGQKHLKSGLGVSGIKARLI